MNVFDEIMHRLSSKTRIRSLFKDLHVEEIEKIRKDLNARRNFLKSVQYVRTELKDLEARARGSANSLGSALGAKRCCSHCIVEGVLKEHVPPGGVR